MKKTNSFSFLFITLFVFACSPVQQSVKKGEDSGGVPSWVSEPPRIQGYEYGVGMATIYSTPAQALSRAKENSRVELIKQLKVRVIGETTASVRREINQGKSNITRSVFNYARSSIEETELPGIKNIKNYVSKKDKQVFSLAELNKSFAELDLSDSLEEIDKRIEFLLKENYAGSTLKEIKRLLPVVKLIEERKNIVKNIKLLSKMSDTPYETKKHRNVIKRLADLLDSLVIVIKPAKDLDKQFVAGLRKTFLNEGIRIRSFGGGDLYMSFSASLNTVERDNAFFTFASGQATILDDKKDIISEFVTKVKAGSSDEKLSSKRATEKLANKLGLSIAKGLFESI